MSARSLDNDMNFWNYYLSNANPYYFFNQWFIFLINLK